MDFTGAIYPPPEMQILIREALLFDDDGAARYLDQLPLPYRLGALKIAFDYYLRPSCRGVDVTVRPPAPEAPATKPRQLNLFGMVR